eukprot:756662-Hanusia_phi.AAC.6
MQDTVEALAACLTDESALLRHEVAYALGQKEEVRAMVSLWGWGLTCLCKISAVPVLTALLKNDQDSMVQQLQSASSASSHTECRFDMKLPKLWERSGTGSRCSESAGRVRIVRRRGEKEVNAAKNSRSDDCEVAGGSTHLPVGPR